MSSFFYRWKHTQTYSWPFRVFKQYYQELNLQYWSILGASNYIYPSMNASGFTWDMNPAEALKISKTKYNFGTLRVWANGYNTSIVWSRLNLIMSLNAILEVYLSTIIALSIESDPGLLINCPHSVDGTYYLHHGGLNRNKYLNFVNAITKGEWSKRIASFNDLFAVTLDEWSSNIATLELLRKKRNSIGHAYGRDMTMARQFTVNEMIPVEGISDKKLIEIFDVVFKLAQSTDKYLLENHIGEFQIILAYHKFLKSNHVHGTVTDKAYAFRKFFGQKYKEPINRQFCMGLADLYESFKKK